MIVVALGGGRMRAADVIDFDVGLSDVVSRGTHVNAGDQLAIIHARTDEAMDLAMREFEQAVTISDAAPVNLPLVQMLTA